MSSADGVVVTGVGLGPAGVDGGAGGGDVGDGESMLLSFALKVIDSICIAKFPRVRQAKSINSASYLQIDGSRNQPTPYSAPFPPAQHMKTRVLIQSGPATRYNISQPLRT